MRKKQATCSSRKKEQKVSKSQNKELLLLNGVKIDKDTQVRYLGVIIDQKLKWHKHIDNRLGSVKRQLFALRNYIGKTCGPSPKMIKYAYTNILRPKLLYACFIFEAELTKGQKQS